MNNSDLVSEVSKVANRKRVAEDVEKLREKLSRETSKIIKLNVSQDTAYWDLKQKLQTVEANHGRLQANMMDVQMQHEAVSTSYQNELRRRPETLNKLAASRAIADTLEENAARLRETLRRQATDCAALQRAYAGAAQRAVVAVAGAQAAVRAQRTTFGVVVDRERAAGERARAEALRAAAAAAAYCQQAESARRDAAASDERSAATVAEVELLRGHLQMAQRDLDQVAARYTVLAEEHEGSKSRESNTSQLLRETEREMERVTGEVRTTRDLLDRRDVEVERARAEVSRLEAALKAECEHREGLLEAERSERARAEAEWRFERDTLVAELGAARDEAVARLEAEAAAERARLESARAAAEERARHFLAEVEANRADLASRADTISSLKRDVSLEAEARARAAHAYNVTEAALRRKEAELSAQIADLRVEKERLNDTIRGMQATIDNIQQLARTRDLQPASTRPVREPAERDDDTNKTLDEMLYSFRSDSCGSLDAAEVERRFAELDRGETGTDNRSGTNNRSGINSRSGTENRSGTNNRSGTDNRSVTDNRSGINNRLGTDSRFGTDSRSGTDNRSGTINRFGTDGCSGTDNRSGTANRIFKNKRLNAKKK